jgi:hypothetical protein
VRADGSAAIAGAAQDLGLQHEAVKSSAGQERAGLGTQNVNAHRGRGLKA